MILKSPAELEIDLKRLESRLSRSLSESFSIVGILLLTLLMLGGIFFLSDYFEGRYYRPNGGFHVLQLIRWTAPVVIGGSPILVLLEKRWLWGAHLLLMLILWGVAVRTFFFNLDARTLFLVSLSVPLYCIGGWAYLKKATNPLWKKRGAIIYAILFLALFLAVSLSLYELNERKFILYWHLKTLFILFMVLYTGLAHTPSNDEAMMALNPINSMRGTLWPIGSALENDMSSRKILWYQGFLNIVTGCFAAGLRVFWEDNWGPLLVNAYLKYSSRYLLAILGIISFLNVLTGIARILGYRVKDATDFVWLSRTPAEYWRRGAVYQYMFIYRFVYLPLVRLLKRPWISSAIAFFVFLINKTSVLDVAYVIGDELGLDLRVSLHSIHYLYYTMTLWILWFVVLKLSRWWPYGRKARRLPFNSWASVLLTHLVMSSLYYFAYLVQFIIWKKPILW